MEYKWWAIFCMVFVLSASSCTALIHHDNTKLRIAQLECQQNEVGDE